MIVRTAVELLNSEDELTHVQRQQIANLITEQAEAVDELIREAEDAQHDAEDEYNTLVQQIDELQEEISTLNREVSDTEGERDDLQLQVRELESDNDYLQTRIYDLEADLD